MGWWDNWGRDLLNLGANVWSANQQGNAAQGAANAQIAGLDRAIDAQMTQYGINNLMADPYRIGGTYALNSLLQTAGLPYMNPQTSQQLMGQQGGPAGGPTTGSWQQGVVGGPVSSGSFGGIGGGVYNPANNSYQPSDLGTGVMYGGGPAAEPGSSPPGFAPGQPGGYGVNPGGAPSMAGFFASPDYNFRFNEGQRAVDQSAAARGGALSGNAIRAQTEYGQNMGAGEFGNWWNRMSGLAGIGQTTTGQQMQGGQEVANNMGNLFAGQGAARASGILGRSNAYSDALNNLLNYSQARWGG